MNRDEILTSIRPKLNLDRKDKKPLELFQNDTLRPILKLQHALTLEILRGHKNYNPKHLLQATRKEYATYVQQHLQSNSDLKNQLLGIIIGMLTIEELDFYAAHRKDINKRIIQMQVQRFVDTEFGLS